MILKIKNNKLGNYNNRIFNETKYLYFPICFYYYYY